MIKAILTNRGERVKIDSDVRVLILPLVSSGLLRMRVAN